MTKQGLSHTRKVAFRACRRRHHYAYGLLLRPIKEALALVVGSALHLWLEAWFGHQDLGRRPEWICPVASPVDPDGQMVIPLIKVELAFEALAKVEPYEAAKLRAMVLAYHLRWRLQDWEIQRVEEPFRAPLVNPDTGEISEMFERDGRIDGLIRIPGGPDEGVWALEHKSHGEPLDPEDVYWTQLRSDAQCSDYMIGARSLGDGEVRGIIYDVVCKPTAEPYKATPVEKRKYTQGVGCKPCGGGKGARGEGSVMTDDSEIRSITCQSCKGTGWKDPPSLYANQRDRDETPGEYGLRCFQIILAEPDRYLHRRAVVRLEDELRDHQLDDWHTAQDIERDSQSEYHPRNPDACFHHGRMCEYQPLCFGGASPTDERLYRISTRHQEQVSTKTIEEE